MKLTLSLCVADIAVGDGKYNNHSLFIVPHNEEGCGHLLRLDSSVDMKLGDLGGT